MAVQTRTCNRCNSALNDDALFCHRCGYGTPSGSDAAIARGNDAATEAARERLKKAVGDHYDIGALIGSGGFAEVFAAYDRQLKREVAIKALRVELSETPAALERFRR